MKCCLIPRPACKSVDDRFNWLCNMFTWIHWTEMLLKMVNFPWTIAIPRVSCSLWGPWCTCGWRSMFSGCCPRELASSWQTVKSWQLADARLDFDVFLLQDPTPFILGEAQRRPFGKQHMCKVSLQGFVKLFSFAYMWLLTSADKVGLEIKKRHLYKHFVENRFLLQAPIIVGLYSGAERLIHISAYSKVSDGTAGFHFWFYGRVACCLYREDRYHQRVILAVLMELQMVNAGSLRGWR